MTERTTHQDRLQLVLTIASIAVGGAVVAVTGDVVIGVAAGAGFFALVRQAWRVWRRTDEGQSPAARDPDGEPAPR